MHAIPVVLVAAALAGCGGGGGSDPAPGGGSGGGASSTPAQTQSQAPSTQSTKPASGPDGAKVFASAGCESCHTLKAAGSSGNVGPNLDELKPDFQTVQTQVTNGGGGMPSFQGQLSAAEITAVARYVSENAGQ